MADGKMQFFLCGTGDPEPAMQALRHPEINFTEDP